MCHRCLVLVALLGAGCSVWLDWDEGILAADAGTPDAPPTPDGGVGGDGDVVDVSVPDGPPCGGGCDGGVCIANACCAEDKVCVGVCCTATTLCNFGACQTPGGECYDATECPGGWYCEYTLGSEPVDAGPGCVGGGVRTGRCLPRPPLCPDGGVPGDPPTCLEECEYRPATTDFVPVLRYSWGDPAAPGTRDSIMMAPVVVQLDDDNCDGLVNERDIPDIVFSTFTSGAYNNNGTLHAISVLGGVLVEKWAVNPGTPDTANHPGRSIAAGDIDGVPGNEIVVCVTNYPTTPNVQRVRAYTAAGVEKWLSDPIGSCFMPQIANLDQVGAPEVIVEGAILDGVTGDIEQVLTPTGTNVIVADVTGDGFLDLVYVNQVLDRDGVLLASVALTGAYPAVADLDRNGVPDIVVADNANHSLHVWHIDPATGLGVIDRQGVDINLGLDPTLCPALSAGRTRGGGPPTVADFDGDDFPDVALAGGVGYAIMEGEALMDPLVLSTDTGLWTRVTQDCSSAATGSSLFDFQGDGKAEVLYGDELTFHVYDGETGDVLFETCNTSGTLFEYPLVADVDNDGQADIIVVSNSYAFSCPDGSRISGVRVFGDSYGSWVRTRGVWNQHPYHVTNVNDDGTIPVVEAANYLDPDLNNFRQNVQPDGEFSAPDLVIDVGPLCMSPYTLVARVTNLGAAAAPAGRPVRFYAGDPAAGGVLAGAIAYTTQALYSAESEVIDLPLPSPPPGLEDGTVPIYATVDEGDVHTWRECRVDNNTAGPVSGDCTIE